MSPHAAILGTGSYLPEKILSNHDIAKRVNTSDEWVKQRVGIKNRRQIGHDQLLVDMVEGAARDAISNSNLDINDIDFILVATSSSEFFFPSVSCQLQQRLLPKRPIPALDLNAACSGFIYALGLAHPLIRSQQYRNILIVGADAYSRLVDWNDRSTCVLFGDGAGAVVLGASENEGIYKINLSADGRYHNCLYATTGIDNLDLPKYIQMQGKETFRMAVHHLGGMLEEAIADTGFTLGDIDWLVPHQANLRIISAAAKRLKLPMDRVATTVTEHGNTVAASIPLALHHAIVNNQVQRGQLLLLEGFGAGFSWGSCLLRY